MIRRIFKTLLITIILLIPVSISGQGGSCTDPALIREFFNCEHEGYYPVCGCDGKTYMNMCSAELHGGVLWINHEGPCEPVDAYIRYNPIDFYMDLTITTNQELSVIIEILDLNGIKQFQQLYSIDGRLNLNIPSSHFSNGYYILHIYSRNYSYVDYFLKYSF